MSDTIYNKLVRDKIPEIITASGRRYTHHIAGDEEYIAKLKEKVVEELEEFSHTPNLEEAADILEAVYAIFKHHNLAFDDVEPIRLAKAAERGGFTDKVILEKVIT
ncbi:MAG: hypothetical protein K0R55_3880 [Sporomusa sp.]|jgi:predicted house-cleaning noncanonical NTP pyrophosphatase (MazG superfamily)|nr:hypothetical protein [Sporomusa sp.]